MVGIEYGGIKTKMNQNKLAQKRHRKALRRKHKKYAGPKYSALEQMYMWEPLLLRAGIIDPQEEGVHGTTTILHRDGSVATTAFTQ